MQNMCNLLQCSYYKNDDCNDEAVFINSKTGKTCCRHCPDAAEEDSAKK